MNSAGQHVGGGGDRLISAALTQGASRTDTSRKYLTLVPIPSHARFIKPNRIPSERLNEAGFERGPASGNPYSLASALRETSVAHRAGLRKARGCWERLRKRCSIRKLVPVILCLSVILHIMYG